MNAIRCGGCGRRCSESDAVCLFCGRDPHATATPSIARKAMTAGGLVMIASAVIAAPVLLAACGCGGCGSAPSPDAGHAQADAGPTGDAGPIFQQ